MTNKSSQGLKISLILCFLAVGSALPGLVNAQGQEMQQKVADVKEAMAKNKQALAQYTCNMSRQIKTRSARLTKKDNIALSPEAGTPGQYKFVISNYLKQGDSMSLVVDKSQKNLVSLSIASYLNDPLDQCLDLVGIVFVFFLLFRDDMSL